MLRDYLERDKSDERKREENPGCHEIKHLQHMSSARTELSKYILTLKKTKRKKEKKKISLHWSFLKIEIQPFYVPSPHRYHLQEPEVDGSLTKNVFLSIELEFQYYPYSFHISFDILKPVWKLTLKIIHCQQRSVMLAASDNAGAWHPAQESNHSTGLTQHEWNPYHSCANPPALQ